MNDIKFMVASFLKKYFILLFVLCLPILAVAQDRLALIIGNDQYVGDFGVLNTCVNDANEMDKCLTALGYQTTVLKDATRQEISNAFKAFEKRISNSTTVGVFYYSGHATVIDGVHLIVPAKTDIRLDGAIRNDCIDIEEIRYSLKKKCKYSFLFLDACRDARKMNELYKGTEALRPSSNVKRDTSSNQQVICYATQLGKVASTGSDKLSPFTKVLTSHLFDKESFAYIWSQKIVVEVEQLTGTRPERDDLSYSAFYFNKENIVNPYVKPAVKNEIRITFNVNPKSKIKFGDKLYDSGSSLLFKVGSTYTYMIEHAGYEPYSGSITVTDSTPSVKNIDLTPVSKSEFKVVCNKPTSAKVYLDGKYQGYAPAYIETTSGHHDVQVAAHKYYTKYTSVDLKPGKNNPLYVSLIRDIPDWFDLNYDDAYMVNYHFSPKYQIGISGMYRLGSTGFLSIGAMFATSVGFYRGWDWSYVKVKNAYFEMSTDASVDDGYGNIVETTINRRTTYGNYGEKYSVELDPNNEAKIHNENVLLLANTGFNVCDGIMLEVGLGGAYNRKRYYMPKAYDVTKITITNKLTGEMIGEPTYEYSKTDSDKWYKGSKKWSPAVRLGARFFIPLDGFYENSLTVGGGYSYLPMNHEFSSWDVTVGFCRYF